jgi:hypothetical protein
MPPVYRRNLRQKAVLWDLAGGYDDEGRLNVDDPVEIDCRWVNKQGQALSPTGTPVALDATVIVNQDIKPGAQMWEGTLSNYLAVGSTDDSDIMEVITYGKTPDEKGRGYRYELGLKRLSSAPAEVD